MATDYPEGTSENVKANFSPDEVIKHNSAKQRFQQQQPAQPAPAQPQSNMSFGDAAGKNLTNAAKSPMQRKLQDMNQRVDDN